MADGVKIEVKGLDKILQQIGSIPKAVADEFDAELSAVSEQFVSAAVGMAPTDQSMLKQGISHKRNGLMDHEVVSSAAYSAFIEFGTRSRAVIPSGVAEYASQFKGSTGQKGLFDAILAWVKRKGITGTYSVKTHRRTGGKATKDAEDKQVAYAIAMSILRQGIHPHPFFFPQLPVAQEQINKNLNQVVERALGK